MFFFIQDRRRTFLMILMMMNTFFSKLVTQVLHYYGMTVDSIRTEVLMSSGSMLRTL
jgi:hypothetical protein